jgi:hypothetical protein
MTDEPRTTLEKMERALSEIRPPRVGPKPVKRMVPKNKSGLATRKRMQSVPRELWPWDRLEANRKIAPFGSGKHRICSHPGCRQVAVRDITVCVNHGGRRVVDERKRALGLPVRRTINSATKLVLRAAIADGALMQHLSVQPVWRAVSEARAAQLNALRSHPLYAERVARRKRGEPMDEIVALKIALSRITALQAKLAHGWAALQDRGEVGPWTDAVRAARDAGLA